MYGSVVEAFRLAGQHVAHEHMMHKTTEVIIVRFTPSPNTTVERIDIYAGHDQQVPASRIKPTSQIAPGYS
jgi:hypothetical protein